MRCSNVQALQACDLHFDFDTPRRGDGQYHGTMTIKICKSKNDAISKGLSPLTSRPKQSGSTNDMIA
jgi:hypothetical protein